jgi:RNA polymerase sigma-70 factor (ECF subfamily)
MSLHAAVQSHLAWVYAIMTRLCLRPAEAIDVLTEAAKRATTLTMPDDGRERALWLLRLAVEVRLEREPSSTSVDFELLDEILRSEVTKTGGVSVRPVEEREHLLWDLKQTCLSATVGCLPPAERVAFVLASVGGLADDEAAGVLGLTTSALKVRLSRARTKLSGYLAPRCQHLDPLNPCQCGARLGVALGRRFVTAPPPGKKLPLYPPFHEEPRAVDVDRLIGDLPEPGLPQELKDKLEKILG